MKNFLKKKLSKYFSILLTLTLVFGTSCSNSTSSENSDNIESSSTCTSTKLNDNENIINEESSFEEDSSSVEESSSEVTSSEDQFPSEEIPNPPSNAGVIYQISTEGTYAEVIGFEGDSTDVIINDTYQDLPVTNIGNYAFAGSKITHIEIPDNIITIGDAAFYGCIKLTNVVISNSTVYIGNRAFQNCDHLVNIVIGQNVSTIGQFAFAYCFSLTNITYNGTIEQWETMDIGAGFKTGVPTKEIICKDGIISL